MPKRMIYKEKEVPSRRLSNAVTKAFLADFKRHGKKAIERVREEKPDVYLSTIAKIMPKQLDVGVQHSFSDVLREAAQAIDSKRESQLIPEYIEGESELIETAPFKKDTGGDPQGEGLLGSHTPAYINISTHSQLDAELTPLKNPENGE